MTLLIPEDSFTSPLDWSHATVMANTMPPQDPDDDDDDEEEEDEDEEEEDEDDEPAVVREPDEE